MIMGSIPLIHPIRSAPFVGPITRLRPDETFYSWVSRMAAAMGGLSIWAVREMLFAGEKALFYPDLATGLGYFVSSSGQTRLTAEELALTTTTYGYFANFLDREGRKALVERMSEVWVVPHHGTGLAHGTYEVRALRFCPSCHATMEQACGERWWRRTHQLPTTYRCPDHGDWLQESEVHWKLMRRGFFLPDDNNCPVRPIAEFDTADETTIALLNSMAQRGRMYLDQILYFDRRKWADFYHGINRTWRLTDVVGEPLVNELQGLLRPRLQARSRFLPFIDLTNRGWLHRLILGSGPATPMEHVVFQAALEAFFGTKLNPTGWELGGEFRGLSENVQAILNLVRSRSMLASV